MAALGVLIVIQATAGVADKGQVRIGPLAARRTIRRSITNRSWRREPSRCCPVRCLLDDAWVSWSLSALSEARQPTVTLVRRNVGIVGMG